MKTYPSFRISALGVQFEQPTTAHSTILHLEMLRSDVMLCAQAFNMASKMADVQIVLVRRFLLFQSG